MGVPGKVNRPSPPQWVSIISEMSAGVLDTQAQEGVAQGSTL